jgi:hypothetical protein
MACQLLNALATGLNLGQHRRACPHAGIVIVRYMPILLRLNEGLCDPVQVLGNG